MTSDALVIWRFIGVFMLGCILISYPVLTLFNVNILLFGIPLLYLYIFVFWLAIIVLINVVSRKHTKKSPQSFFIADTKK